MGHAESSNSLLRQVSPRLVPDASYRQAWANGSSGITDCAGTPTVMAKTQITARRQPSGLLGICIPPLRMGSTAIHGGKLGQVNCPAGYQSFTPGQPRPG